MSILPKLPSSRRSVVCAMRTVLLATLLGNQGPAAASNAAPGENDRLARVQQRLRQTGFPGLNIGHLGEASRANLISFQPSSNLVMLSAAIIDLCENDGQLAAVVVHQLLRTRSLPPRARQTRLRAGTTVPIATLDGPPNTASVANSHKVADAGIIGVLAQCGYDPRDGLMIWQRIGRVGGDGFLPHATRLATISTGLLKLGYQI